MAGLSQSLLLYGNGPGVFGSVEFQTDDTLFLPNKAFAETEK